MRGFNRGRLLSYRRPRSPGSNSKWAFALPPLVIRLRPADDCRRPRIRQRRFRLSLSLDAASGCVYWSFHAQSGVASAPLIEPRPGHANQVVAYFGDIRGNAYAVDAANGELVWKTMVDEHQLSRIRGGMKFYNGRLYVPVTTLEEVESGSFNYKCCNSRGWSLPSTRTTEKNSGRRIRSRKLPPRERRRTGRVTSVPREREYGDPPWWIRKEKPSMCPPGTASPNRRPAVRTR